LDLHEIVETLEGYSDESPLLMEPRSDYDPCLVGIGYRFKDGPLAVYDINKVLKVLQTRDGMSEEGSEEFFQFNIVGSWVGDGTPMFIEPLE